MSDYILKRELTRVIVRERDNYLEEIIQAKVDGTWISCLKNINNLSTLVLETKLKRFSKKYYYKKRTKKKLYFMLTDDDFDLNLDYCLEEDNILHTRYKFFNRRELELSKIAIRYQILLGKNPDFTWTPHLRPEEGLVIGDHVYRSPALIYSKDKITIVFIPDLKTLGQNRPFQNFLDYNLNNKDPNSNPEMSYGYGKYKPYKHTFFKHNPIRSLHIKENSDLTLRFYIILFINRDVSDVLKWVNRFFWEKYGRKHFYGSIEPQIIPFEDNVKEGYAAIFKRHQLWGDFQINDSDCGGIFQRTWTGGKKTPIKYIKQEELSNFKTQNLSAQRIAEIWNNAWYLNIRTAYGLKYYGNLWNDTILLEKASRIINTALNLPRQRGLFPSVILPSECNSPQVNYINGVKAFFYSSRYNLVDISLAMFWLLKYSQDFSEYRKKIIDLSKELILLMKEIQSTNGELPTLIYFEEIAPDTPIIDKDMTNTANSGAPLMFLLEYYNCTKDEGVLKICEKLVNYLELEIVSTNKWIDFEALYSCTHPLFAQYDNYTENNVINNLSIYWCAESYKELYKITNNNIYLDIGERILSILSLFQQVWDMPYISINTFGGFGCQNIDAELNDARQALFVRTYLDYYMITGNWEYFERGIAALRASWVLQLIEENLTISPGNFRKIDTYDGIDEGCVLENYGHPGKDKQTPGLIMFDWGVGTASTITAYVHKHFGDLYIDIKNEFVFGINGVLIKKFDFKQGIVKIECEILQRLNKVKIKGIMNRIDTLEIVINEKSIGFFAKEDLGRGFFYSTD